MKKILLIFICFFIFTIFAVSESIQERIINEARNLIGTPYRIGGINPSGFDCSGFISYLYKPHVNKLPRVSRDMAESGISVKKSSLMPGDLIFFATGSSSSRVTHVALFIGQNSIIHSISNGPERGVTISSLNARYWKTRYHNSARILKLQKIEEESELTYTDNAVFAKGIYSGELKRGEPSGKGIMLMKNGDRYDGEFLDGLFNGTGVYTWSEGRQYSGSFLNGDFTGRGIMTAERGEKADGKWINGEFKNDSMIKKEKVSASSDKNMDKTESKKLPKYGEKPKKTENNKKKAREVSENYMIKEDSPWETYDGIVEGDFDLWFKKDMNAFEEWKKTH